MAIHVTPQIRRAIVRLVGPLAFAALVLLGGAAVGGAAQAAAVCGDRDRILKNLEQRHAELPSAVGLSADGGVLEILVAPDGGWTILVTYPERLRARRRRGLADAAARRPPGVRPGRAIVHPGERSGERPTAGPQPLLMPI